MSNFKVFATQVAVHFQSTISPHELYRVAVSGDELWDLYLASFPEGTNPLFRKRTEHDGSYDRSFVRRLGNVVAIIEGELVSMWDAPLLESPYREVSAVLSQKVRGSLIESLFRTKEPFFGYVFTVEKLPEGGAITWNHFYAAVAKRHNSKKVDEDLGEAATTVSVLKRGLEEITPESLNEIADLIGSNALYRGEEHQHSVTMFRALQASYRNAASDQARNLLLWQSYGIQSARFRNTVIGTLAVDLSEGKPVEQAVAAFEAKVAPANYKRPTAVISAGMVKTAMATIAKLDLEPALQRRHAKLSDVSVNNVLWVSNSARPKMKDGIAGILADAVAGSPVSTDKTEEIGIEAFLANVLPKARSLEMLVQGTHQKNLVSITAPVDPCATPLFKWDSGFAWSYKGDITDAIKERVKAAGGNIQADLRVSLAWHNYDDLDLHAICPYGHIFYQQKMGILDVDMNAGAGTTRTPVENLAFIKPKDGTYYISVNQFSKRETSNVGFTIEVECQGELKQFSYPLSVPDRQVIEVLSIQMDKGRMWQLNVVNKDIVTKGLSQSVWGIQTEKFVPVSTVMHSPNFWDGRKIGNLHTFFILEGCANPEPTRGIYNEFLRSDLEQHRKVFEVLGSKTKCEPAAEQLSGLGFSSTVRESITARVIGQTINKLYKINF